MIVTRELQLEQIALDKIKGLKVEKLQGLRRRPFLAL
jgi:hypothetical protein